MTETSVSEGDFTITSTNETAEQISASLSDGQPQSDKPDLSKAAAELGRKGGEASAAARAEAAKEAKAETARSLEHPDATDAITEAEPAADTSPEKPLGKPRDDPRARMLEATRQAAEAKRERDAVKARADQLERELAEARAGKPQQAPKTTAEDDAEPQEGDFDDYRDFVKAVARHEYRQAEKQAVRAHQERQYHDGISQAVDSFTKRMNEAEAADASLREKLYPLAVQMDPSFKAKAEGRRLGPINVITDEIINSEIAPALTLHLAEHPEAFQRLMALRTPTEIQIAIAKLEGKLESQSAAPTAPAPRLAHSQANPPVKTVNGSPHTADQAPDPDASSFDDHLRYWNAKERRAR